jgi:hypothetical protein
MYCSLPCHILFFLFSCPFQLSSFLGTGTGTPAIRITGIFAFHYIRYPFVPNNKPVTEKH